MPIQPLGSKRITLTKASNEGNNPTFSNGKPTVEIIAWEMKNTRQKRQYSPYSKIYNDETALLLRTHNPFAQELESDDSVKWEGRNYSVQSVRPVDVPLGVNKQNYEISLR